MDSHKIEIKLPKLHLPQSKYLPTPGNMIFTLLVVGGLIVAQFAGVPNLFASPSYAGASTGAVPYQGRIADASGAPLTSVLGIIFRLYGAQVGGVPLWEEQWTGSNSVAVSDGLFNVMLGSLNPIPQSLITSSDALFLGITVGSDDEMTPRVQLGSVPYAIQALTVPDGSVTAAKLAGGAVDATKLADGAVTAAKLGPDIQFIPSGAIIMWSGAIAAVPSGWQVCDGSAGTPDLRDRFIVGAGSSYAVGATGGVAQVTLTVDQIPSHSHSYTDKYTNGNRVSGSHAWDATTDKNPDYSSDTKTTSSVGGGQAHENRPPYYALAYICKQ